MDSYRETGPGVSGERGVHQVKGLWSGACLTLLWGAKDVTHACRKLTLAETLLGITSPFVLSMDLFAYERPGQQW